MLFSPIILAGLLIMLVSGLVGLYMFLPRAQYGQVVTTLEDGSEWLIRHWLIMTMVMVSYALFEWVFYVEWQERLAMHGIHREWLSKVDLDPETLLPKCSPRDVCELRYLLRERELYLTRIQNE